MLQAPQIVNCRNSAAGKRVRVDAMLSVNQIDNIIAAAAVLWKRRPALFAADHNGHTVRERNGHVHVQGVDGRAYSKEMEDSARCLATCKEWTVEYTAKKWKIELAACTTSAC